MQLQPFPGARSRVRFTLAACLTLFVLATSLGAGVASAANAPVTTGPRISWRVSPAGPLRVGVPVVVTARLSGVSDVRGIEAHLAFPRAQLHFRGLAQFRAAIGGARGRSVELLGPREDASGASFGMYCAAGCGKSSEIPAPSSGRSADFARIEFVPLDTSAVELRVAAVVVDASGARVPVRSDPLTLGRAPGRPVAGAPRSDALAAQRPSRRGAVARDLSGDGRVSLSDPREAGLAWSDADGASSCGSAAPAADVTGDGCIDVADLVALSAAAEAAPPAPAATAPATWVVNGVGDGADVSSTDGRCLAADGTCTLRAAIRAANDHVGADRITFAIPGTGVHRIAIGDTLPSISDTTGGLTIDGYTQPGAAPNTQALVSNAVIRIELVGPGDAVSLEAFFVTSANNVIRGLAMYDISRKFYLEGTGAHDNVIAGNFIGTDATGTHRSPALQVNPSYGAIWLYNAPDNLIGGTAPADRNVISGNQAYGIYTYGENASRTRIYGNLIGLSPDGARPLGNWVHGVDLNFGSSDNLIGGTDPGQANVVSGNTRTAIEISHGTNTLRNHVVGNRVGTTPNGSAAVFAAGSICPSTACSGVHIEDGSSESVISDNVIAGNIDWGIWINGHSTIHTTVTRNRIGVGVNGEAIPNTKAGIEVVFHATDVTIGPDNEIANERTAIYVADDDNDRVIVSRNSIHDNTVMGYDLAPQGTNANGGTLASGPNDAVPHPAIGGASPGAVTGSACPGCTVEVFLAQRDADDYGQGTAFVGSAVADANGRFSASVTGLSVGDLVTATATDTARGTSEFGLVQPVRAQLAPEGGALLVQDSFNREVASGWGAASTGGLYTVDGSVGAYSVSNGAGVVRVSVVGRDADAALRSLDIRDIDVATRVERDNQPAGASQYAMIQVRGSAGGAYRAKLRFSETGGAYLSAAKLVGTAEQTLGAETALGATGTGPWSIRAQVYGSDPTTLRLKAWPATAAEPANWSVIRTDTEAVLQRPGTLALVARLGSGVTNAPTTFLFQYLQATAVDPAAPDGAPLPDREAPDGSVSIAGNGYVNTSNVTVNVPAADEPGGSGVAQVRLSNDGAVSGGVLVAGRTQSYAPSVSWSLVDPAYGGRSGDGSKTVFVQWADGAGNWSAVRSATVVLDTVRPTATISTPQLSYGTALGAGGTIPVRVNWSASDAGSGIASYALKMSTDGGAWQVVSLAPPTATSMSFQLAAGHSYRFTASARDGAGNASLWATGITVSLAAVQEGDAGVTYSTPWTSVTTSTAFGGAYRYTTTANRSVSLSFTGRAVSWVTPRGVSSGTAYVYVDNVRVATVDLYAASTESQRVVFSRSFSTSGAHTLRIVATGLKRTAATGTRVAIDGFAVLR